MWVYICLVCLVCIISFLFEKYNRKIVIDGFVYTYKFEVSKIGCVLVFLILGFFSAARDGIGIDYEGYYKHIILIQQNSPHYMEIGFKSLVHFLSWFSTNPRWVIILLSFLTVFFYMFVIVKWSPNIPLSLFLFMTWGYYFFSFNTIRNYLAQSLALVSLLFLAKKKYINFICCVIIAALFHKSAFICIPLYLLAQKDYKKKYIILIVSLICTAFLFRNQFHQLFFGFYPGYEGSAYDTGEISWLNILKAIFVIGISIFFYKYDKDDIINRICFNLNIFALVFYIGFYWTPEISRIGFYMNTTAIIFLPRLLARESINCKRRFTVNLALIIGSSILFFLLMRGWYSYTIQLLPYKTWIGGIF